MKRILKFVPLFFVILLITNFPVFAQQEQIRIMAYNLLEYWNSATDGSNTFRDPKFRAIINATTPDILAACEINDNTSGNAIAFKNNVLNYSSNIYEMGTFVPDGSHSDANVIYYKPSLFTFLSSKLIIPEDVNTNHPSYEYQLYDNLTGDKITIFGIHFTSGNNTSGETYRNANANTIRSYSNALPSGAYFIAAGDYNFYSGGNEPAFATLIDNTNAGYFIDPLNLPKNDPWTSSTYYGFHTLSTRLGSSFGGSNETYGLKYRSDLILNSQTVVNNGGVTYNGGTYTTYGNDGNHHLQSVNNGSNGAVSSAIADALYYASDHLPVYADYTFAIPSTINPPYPGSIVFTQVGTSDGSGNYYIEFMTLYRMNLTTLKITSNAVQSNGTISAGNLFDLSYTNWTDVPAGTFVRLGTNLIDDNNPSDRILKYSGDNGYLGTLPSFGSGSNQAIAYTGSSPNPTYYIAGIHWGDMQGWSSSSNEPFDTPSSSNIALISTASENWYFSGSASGNLYSVRNTVTAAGNWSDAGTGFQDLTANISNSALPVQLSSFTGDINNSETNLYWRTETEVNNYGFEIQRSTGKTVWTGIGFVAGSGNSNSPKNYSFTDKSIPAGKIYYRLKQEDNDGKFAYSSIIELDNLVSPVVELLQNYPNPFNPTTTIEFRVPVDSRVKLKIIDVLGRVVKTLVDGEVAAGLHKVPFDGTSLSSGFYIYQLITNGKIQSKKMLLLK